MGSSASFVVQVAVAVAVAIIAALAAVWALNTLFLLGIPYTREKVLAVLVLGGAFNMINGIIEAIFEAIVGGRNK